MSVAVRKKPAGQVGPAMHENSVRESAKPWLQARQRVPFVVKVLQFGVLVALVEGSKQPSPFRFGYQPGLHAMQTSS